MLPAAGDEPSLYPELSVVCPACDDEVELVSGFHPLDVVWMHQHYCRAALQAFDFTDLG